MALRLHWEACYFPQAGLPITRGWFRQDDWQHNEILYDSPTPAQYVAWLRDLGVSDVFVPHAALDMSSVAEPSLIVHSGAFVRVFDDAGWTVYRLRDPRPLVVDSGASGSVSGATPSGSTSGSTAPASVSGAAPPAAGAAVTAVSHDAVTVSVRRPGSYVVKFTWTPYWRLAGPGVPGGGAQGSLAPAPGDWTLLRAGRAGTYTLRVRPTLGAALSQIF